MVRKLGGAACAVATVATSLLITAHGALAQTSDARGPSFQIVSQFKPGGEGGWDFLDVDSARRRLYVTRGDTVRVIDTNSGKLLATLSGLHGTHGIAIAGQHGFVTNGKSNAVTIFDVNTSKKIASIAGTGNGPDAIVYEPKQRRVYTMNHKGGSVTVIDTAARKAVATIDALPDLESGVSDGKGRPFVNSESENELAVIDVHAKKMVAAWKLGDCEGPTGLAMDVAHNRLFSTCANHKMVVIDALSGKVVTEVPIGGRSDAAAFDAGLGMVYSSNGEGSLTAVHEDDPDHFHVVADVPTLEGARTMALDQKSHAIYLATASYGPAPAATADTPKPRKPILAGSFEVMVIKQATR